MTTKFLDNKICTFNILLSWRFPRKTAFLDDFPLCPQDPPPGPSKTQNYIFIVVSWSLKNFGPAKGSNISGKISEHFREKILDGGNSALVMGF